MEDSFELHSLSVAAMAGEAAEILTIRGVIKEHESKCFNVESELSKLNEEVSRKVRNKC